MSNKKIKSVVVVNQQWCGNSHEVGQNGVTEIAISGRQISDYDHVTVIQVMQGRDIMEEISARTPYVLTYFPNDPSCDNDDFDENLPFDQNNMKLELKNITPYLPYGIGWKFEGEDFTHDVIGLDMTYKGVKLVSPYYDFGSCSLNEGRPILRPVSSITKEEAYSLGESILGDKMEDRIIHIHESHIVYEAIPFLLKDDKPAHITISFEDDGIDSDIKIPFKTYEYLFRNHFDVFSLIKKGLAIDKNTLE